MKSAAQLSVSAVVPQVSKAGGAVPDERSENDQRVPVGSWRRDLCARNGDRKRFTPCAVCVFLAIILYGNV